MKNLFKNKIVTILILLATLALAGVAIFTAWRLYQLRQQAVAPTAPESKPEAAPPQSCTALTFSLQQQVPGLSCTTKTAWKDDSRNRPQTYYLDEEIPSGSNVTPGQTFVYSMDYENTGTTTASGATITDALPSQLEFVDADTDCTFASATKTVTCSLGNIAAGGKSQTAIRVKVLSSAASGTLTNRGTLTFTGGTSSNCEIGLAISSTTTPTPTPTPTPTSTTTPTTTTTTTPTATTTSTVTTTATPTLPVAGVSTPTLFGIGIGVLAIILSLVLAL